MNIYALLVGINEYPRRPLNQCVNDVAKIEAYLDSLKSSKINIKKKILTNKKATKNAIVKGIKNFLSKATDKDVALFYFSGHGAYEDANGLFDDEQDGAMECIVAYHTSKQKGGFLLADKEIRFLFKREIPHNPHLVSIFDCCHSGDMVRDGEGTEQFKKLTGVFKARKYNQFIFHKKLNQAKVRAQPTAQNFPFKNHIHIAACLSSQLSWEDSKGGVFTRFLLKLVTTKNSKLSYHEITRWAKMSIKDVTQKNQSPTITVQGHRPGGVTASSSWLNLHDADSVKQQDASIVYNDENKEWNLTLGELMGIKKGTKVSINLETEKAEVEVKEVDLTTALIENPQKKGYAIDTTKITYPVTVDPAFATLTLYVNNIDGLAADKKVVEDILKTTKNVELITTNPGKADFFINIFNEMVYISLPANQFQPLGRQIDLLNPNITLKDVLEDQVQYLIKWNHFDSLKNPGTNFDKPPIKVELKVEGTSKWHDITEDTLELVAEYSEKYKTLVKIVEVRVTNVSEEKIYVALLNLQSDIGISSEQWDRQVIELNPEETKYFYDHKRTAKGILHIEKYKQIYNWKEEWFHYQFIVNNFDDFTPALQKDYLQANLDSPMLIDERTGEIIVDRNIIAFDDWDEFVQRWDTFKSTIRLKNSECNIKSAGLEKDHVWDFYTHNEHLAPFINQLYLKNEVVGWHNQSEALPNKSGAKDINGFKKNLGNYLDNLRRKRHYRRAKKRMPNQPRIVAEGDSWFLYPFLVEDILDYVMKEFPVCSIAAAGDELKNYKKDGQLLKTVKDEEPKFVLISGGGNDVIGPNIKNVLKTEATAGLPVSAYLKQVEFDKTMAKLKGFYEYFIKELKKEASVEQLFLHGYDYIRTDHPPDVIYNGWVVKHLQKKKITAPSDQAKIIKHLVDTFNDILIDLSQNDEFVTYIPLRGKVKKGQWYDEIHPTDEGFEVLGNQFIEAINGF